MADTPIKTYLVESYVPELDVTAAARISGSLSAATTELRARGVAIELLYSFALVTEEVCFSLFSAASPVDVRSAVELARVAYGHVAEVISYSRH